MIKETINLLLASHYNLHKPESKLGTRACSVCDEKKYVCFVMNRLYKLHFTADDTSD
jgi:hypothetical protein